MTRACPDCPAVRSGILAPLVDRPSGCAFRCLPVAAREPLPVRWRGEYGLALIRRGIVIRQRVDVHGRATAVDIAGAGSAIPFGTGEDGADYAVDDALLCLCPTSAFESAVDSGRHQARDVVKAQAAIIARVERIAEARGRDSTKGRVASLLLAILETLSPPRRVDVVPAAIQQRDLAGLLAMRHESVCRAVTALVRDGAVARTPHGLRVLDRARLASDSRCV